MLPPRAPTSVTAVGLWAHWTERRSASRSSMRWAGPSHTRSGPRPARTLRRTADRCRSCQPPCAQDGFQLPLGMVRLPRTIGTLRLWSWPMVLCRTRARQARSARGTSFFLGRHLRVRKAAKARRRAPRAGPAGRNCGAAGPVQRAQASPERRPPVRWQVLRTPMPLQPARRTMHRQGDEPHNVQTMRPGHRLRNGRSAGEVAANPTEPRLGGWQSHQATPVTVGPCATTMAGAPSA